MESAKHCREQIVEVMRDAAGQLPDRIHLAGLDQLRFEVLLFGDIENRARNLNRVALAVSEQHRMFKEVPDCPVFAAPAIFDRDIAEIGQPAIGVGTWSRSSGWTRSRQSSTVGGSAKPVIRSKSPPIIRGGVRSCATSRENRMIGSDLIASE